MATTCATCRSCSAARFCRRCSNASTIRVCASPNDFAFKRRRSAEKRLRHGARRASSASACDSTYVSGRSSAWIKLKCRRRQEFVIGGYSEPAGSRAAVRRAAARRVRRRRQAAVRGARGHRLRSVDARSGQEGNSTSARQAHAVRAASRSERSRTPVHWVKPELVAECNFAEWTKERIVRQASFVSLRDDKPARQIVKEEPKPVESVEAEEEGKASKPAKKSAAKAATKTATKTAAKKAKDTSTSRRREDQPSRSRDRQIDRHPQDRSRAVLRVGRRLDAAAS